MSDLQWAQVRARDPKLSWHVLGTFTRMPGVGQSLCKKRLALDTLRDTRPAGKKTCELCLRKAIGDAGPFGDAGAAVSPV